MMQVDGSWLKDTLDSALSGGRLSLEDATALLELPLGTDDSRAIAEAAHALALRHSRQGRIWTAIGVDYCPCPQNCSFCSFGVDWGIIRDSHEWTEEQVVDAAARFAAEGASWITIRTTQHYPLERVCRLAKAMRERIPNCPTLVANVGEMSLDQAEMLYEAGYSVAYHVFRLREGTDTGIDAEERLRSLENIHRSRLGLAFLAEPIGPEHTAAEIAREMVRARDLGAVIMGAMARVPVPGTPKAHLGQISEEKLARIIAVSRLVGGEVAQEICVHPPSDAAVAAGANAVVVETGAVPREREEIRKEWRGLTMAQAKQLLGRHYPSVAGA
jgi:biotin synthase